jgi:biopolymer transport protein ExbB/TolQ
LRTIQILPCVAPGIAEALLCDSSWIGCAIPAVFSYNKITSDLSKYFIVLRIIIDDFYNNFLHDN